MKRCLKCQAPYADGDTSCPQCGSTSFMNEAAMGVLTELAGNRTGSKPKDSGARAALIWGLVGFLICGPVLGTVAIVKGLAARQAIARDPGSRETMGTANAAIIMGIVDWVVFVLGVIIRLTVLSQKGLH